MRLVLVDDEPAILDVLAAACTADGHTVVTFSSSTDALRYLEENPAELLIADIVMPPPDGFRLVSAARKMQPTLAAILVTGYSSRYSLEDVLACGASDLLFKPFRLQELRVRVRLAQERRRLQMQFEPRPLSLDHPSEDPARAHAEARRAVCSLVRKAG
jgi:DNA-binding response OmpR family regulator